MTRHIQENHLVFPLDGMAALSVIPFFFMRTALSILLAGTTASLLAQEGLPEVSENANPEDIASNIVKQLETDWLAPFGWVQELNQKRKEFMEESGLSWTASYHSVALASALGDGVDFGASGDFTLQGIWRMGERWIENPTELRFRLRHRHSLGGTAASELGPATGTLWGVVDGFSNSGFEIPDFYFRHHFRGPDLEVRYGQLSIDSQFGGHRLSSAKSYFLNQGFASDPAIAFPRFGAGATALLKLDRGYSLGLGTTTVQGTQTGSQVDLDIGSGDLFYGLQLARDFYNKADLARRLQFFAWYSDAIDDADRSSGYGFSFTYEGTLNALDNRAFARFSWSEGGAAPLDYLLTVGYTQSFGDDGIRGLAAGVGRGSSSEQNIQGVVEAFWRWSPVENLTITPDVQLLIGEGYTEGPGVRIVGGVRLGLSF